MPAAATFWGLWEESPQTRASPATPVDTDMTNSIDPPGNSGGQEPSPYNEHSQDPSALSPREQQTVAGLRRLDPQLAGLYELGRKLVNEIQKPGYAHTVAYVARELSRGVIRCRLRDEGIDTSAQNAAGAGSATDGEGNQQRIAAALQLPEDDPRVTQWLRMPGRFAAWEKYRYGGPSTDEVREAFEQFSEMLFGLAAPYYATVAELDSLLDVDAPASKHARRLRDLQLRPAQRRHFCERLKDPRWVKHLANQGFFANPPVREIHDDGTWNPRLWPEGDYLIRIASEAPADVVRVLVAVPSTNDNPMVWNSVAKAASQLPADLAVRVVPALTSALESVPGLIRWSDSVVGLIEYLAASGSSEAFDLADHLLFIAGAAPVDTIDTAFRNRTVWVVPRLGGQDWQGIVDRVVAALEGTNPERTLRLLLSKVSRRSGPGGHPANRIRISPLSQGQDVLGELPCPRRPQSSICRYRHDAWVEYCRCSSAAGDDLPLPDRLLQPQQPVVPGQEVVADPHPPHPARTDLDLLEHQLVGHTLGTVGRVLQRVGQDRLLDGAGTRFGCGPLAPGN